MAKFRPAQNAEHIVGSVGGVTFKRSRYGYVCYAKPHPTRHRSVNQRYRTRWFSILAHRWRNTLTAAQRNAWNTILAQDVLPYRTRRLSPNPGYNAFLQHNLFRLFATKAVEDDAPPVAITSPSPSWWPTFTNNSRIQINFVGDPLLVNQTAVIMLSHPFSPGVLNPRTWQKQVWRTHGPQAGWRFYDITPPIFPGSQVRISMWRVHDRERFSPPYELLRTWVP